MSFNDFSSNSRPAPRASVTGNVTGSSPSNGMSSTATILANTQIEILTKQLQEYQV